MRNQVSHAITAERTKYHAELLVNRVRKRYAHLSKRFKKQGIECFRLYDWDIPEIRAVIDWYAGHLVVAEYERLQTDDQWLSHVANAVAQALGVSSQKTFIKRRRTMTAEGPRYEVMGKSGHFFEVSERNLRFRVNLNDYLDTGLYSDHRNTRLLIQNYARDKDFLNLFAYTGAFTCAAASAGAKSTTTVDRSETYLKWAKDNMELNGLYSESHVFAQSDVDRFLQEARLKGRKYTLAFVDPPSFFQDHARGISFDINRDHPYLIQNVINVMAPGAMLFFSTNHQRFEPQLEDLRVRELKELTPQTIPEDYRNRRIHRCWQMIVI